MSNPNCTVEGCEKPLRSSGAKYCKMHYHRLYRHGDVTKTATKSDVTVSHGRRYKAKHKPQHPLAMKDGRVYEHRMVLFDEIGFGPHECFWCGTEIDWLPKGDPKELQPDHLNDMGDDNRIENLVPSCRTCNSLRGSQRRHDALRAAGFWSNHDTVEVVKPRRPRVA